MARIAESVSSLRRGFAWSNSPAAWCDRLGWLAWVLVGYGYYRWLSAAANPGPAHLAVGLLLFAGLVLGGLITNTGLGRLLGPVLFYDILRNARRGRFILMRWLYAVGLLLLLFWVHSIWQLDHYRRGSLETDYKALAKLAEDYFIAFSITQFAVVLLITPAYVAGAIAEEKERKTLEFLLATDLENREIVLGKLVSRAGNLALFVLTGLPVLSLMQFFGGIDPGLLLASFAATALTALSLCGISILNSVLRRRARDAIVLTYLAIVGYLLLTGVTAFIEQMLIYHYKSLVWLGIDWTRVFAWFHAGNPIFGLFAIGTAIAVNSPLSSVLAEELERYAVFHLTIFVACVAWAVIRLRAVALTENAIKTRKPGAMAARARQRKPVGLQPMVWKELRIEGRLRLGVAGRLVVALLIAAGFVPVALILYFPAIERALAQSTAGPIELLNLVLDQLGSKWDEIGVNLNAWLRVMNVVISTLMLLGVAVRAAGSIGGERDRDTLTSLMTTTLSTREIMNAKWLGALASVRVFLWWLGAVWLVAMVFGAVNPAAILLHACGWIAPAACFASVGLWFSAACRTTLRATAWTIATAILFGGGHWLCVGMCCLAPLAYGGSGSGSIIETIVHAELAMTPPFIFGWDPFREPSQLIITHREVSMPTAAVVGMLVWGFAAGVVFAAAHERFVQLTNRNPARRFEPANQAPNPPLPSADAGEPPCPPAEPGV